MSDPSNISRTGVTIPIPSVNQTTIAFVFIFTIFYIAVASLGIQTYNDCKEVQGVKKWDNLKMLLSHTMTIAITIPVGLFLQYIASGRVSAVMGVIYGIMGLVGSAIAYALTQEKKCSESIQKDSKNYLIFSIIASIIIILAGGVILSQNVVR
jgi:hypothetical protein